MGLRLKSGLDLARSYPSANKVIERNQQLYVLAKGSYAAFPKILGDEAIRAAIEKLKAAGSLDLTMPVMAVGDTVYARLAAGP